MKLSLLCLALVSVPALATPVFRGAAETNGGGECCKVVMNVENLDSKAYRMSHADCKQVFTNHLDLQYTIPEKMVAWDWVVGQSTKCCAERSIRGELRQECIGKEINAQCPHTHPNQITFDVCQNLYHSSCESLPTKGLSHGAWTSIDADRHGLLEKQSFKKQNYDTHTHTKGDAYEGGRNRCKLTVSLDAQADGHTYTHAQCKALFQSALGQPYSIPENMVSWDWVVEQRSACCYYEGDNTHAPQECVVKTAKTCPQEFPSAMKFHVCEQLVKGVKDCDDVDTKGIRNAQWFQTNDRWALLQKQFYRGMQTKQVQQ